MHMIYQSHSLDAPEDFISAGMDHSPVQVSTIIYIYNVYTINQGPWGIINKVKLVSLVCIHSVQLSILIVNVCLSPSGRVTIPEPSTVQCRPQEEKETGVCTVFKTLVGHCVCLSIHFDVISVLL